MKRTYIETSVWAMAQDGQPEVLRQPTLEFFAQCKARRFLPHISTVVASELRNSPPELQKKLLQRVDDVDPTLLTMPSEAEELAERFIAGGILSNKRLEDARHVACAVVNQMELLVSWNYRHIANVRRAESFNAIAILAGWSGKLEIHTPLEVLEWK